MIQNKKISLILPCRNEAGHLEEVLRLVPDYIDEILIVSNKSTDNTVAVAKQLAKKERRIVVIEDNRTIGGIGYGYAHMSGIAKASGDIIVGADGDGTYPLHDIKKITKHLLANDADFISCNRYPLKDGTKIPLKLRLGVGILNWEIRLLYGIPIKDALSGMWIFRKNIRDKLGLTMGEWNLSPQIKINAARNKGIAFAEYNISQEQRLGETKQSYFKTGFQHALWILKNRFSFFKKFKLHHWFILLFITGGVAFSTITPLGLNADEPNHVFRAYQLSTGEVIASYREESGQKYWGGAIPNSLWQVFWDTHSWDEMANPAFKWTSIRYSDSSLKPIDPSITEHITFNNTTVYAPLAYTPSTIAFWVGSLFNTSTVGIIYLARIFTLIATALLIAGAIKIAPRFKWVLFTVALMPITISLGASVSADPISIGLSFLFIAYVLRLALQNRSIKNTQVVLLLISLGAIVLTKTSYSTVALILLLIPILNGYTRNFKTLAKLASVIVISVAIGMVWLRLVGDMTWPQVLRPLADPDTNEHFILNNPLSYLKVLLLTALTPYALDLTGLIGMFGWASIPMSHTMMITGIVALIISAFTISGKERPLFTNTKIVVGWWGTLIATLGVTTAVIATSLYVYWSDKLASTVAGLQARYYLPVLPLALMLLAPLGALRRQKLLKFLLVMLIIITILSGLLTAYLRYYITV